MYLIFVPFETDKHIIFVANILQVRKILNFATHLALPLVGLQFFVWWKFEIDAAMTSDWTAYVHKPYPIANSETSY